MNKEKLKKLITKQVNILEKVLFFEQDITHHLNFLLEDVIVENECLELIQEHVKNTIIELTDEVFWSWIDWYVYETNFGIKYTLYFHIENVKNIEPTLDNIFKYCLKEY